MEIKIKKFYELTAGQLYDILKLRCAVFVVEQKCPYQDIDDLDQKSVHVWLEENGRILSYLRVIPCPKEGYAAIGRVISSLRRQGYGSRVLQEGIRVAENMGFHEIRLNAQTYAVPFYSRAGFVMDGKEYTEDGIPHIPMKRSV